VEQGSKKMLRFGSFVWLGKGRTSFTALVEKGFGKRNYWYKVTFNQNLGRLDLGLRGWRYVGIGPPFSISGYGKPEDLGNARPRTI